MSEMQHLLRILSTDKDKMDVLSHLKTNLEKRYIEIRNKSYCISLVLVVLPILSISSWQYLTWSRPGETLIRPAVTCNHWERPKAGLQRYAETLRETLKEQAMTWRDLESGGKGVQRTAEPKHWEPGVGLQKLAEIWSRPADTWGDLEQACKYLQRPGAGLHRPADTWSRPADTLGDLEQAWRDLQSPGVT